MTPIHCKSKHSLLRGSAVAAKQCTMMLPVPLAFGLWVNADSDCRWLPEYAVKAERCNHNAQAEVAGIFGTVIRRLFVYAGTVFVRHSCQKFIASKRACWSASVRLIRLGKQAIKPPVLDNQPL
jgi:hypothetical protein